MSCPKCGEDIVFRPASPSRGGWAYCIDCGNLPDAVHAHFEDVDDASMCLCGLPVDHRAHDWPD